MKLIGPTAPPTEIKTTAHAIFKPLLRRSRLLSVLYTSAYDRKHFNEQKSTLGDFMKTHSLPFTARQGANSKILAL